MDGQTATVARNESEIWTSPVSFATTMLLVFIDRYGTEGLSWDSETIRMEIEDDFRVPPAAANFDRLQVAIALLRGNDFYKSLPDFVNFCNVLSGGLYAPEVWDMATAAEVAWGITEAAMIDPPDEEEPFADEIRGYIGAAVDAEGMINPPDILRLALRTEPRIPADFTDDPTMFAAIASAENDKRAEIEQMLVDNLRLLVQQIEGLSLRHGETKGVVQSLLQALP